MTEPTVNIPLLRKGLEWAEAEAEKPFEFREWHQADWSCSPSQAYPSSADVRAGVSLGAQKSPECGTCYCFAGYVAQSVDARYAKASWVDEKHSSDFAAEALGLSEMQRLRLFDATNSIADVRRIAESIAGERL